ncbi:WXG100 family type VII secretion target [Knoellia sp. Soil729]|uniref:WXG100 family type VII secretion target n=1 Tax=Knoellia sp. Soil729 TaxID=1736394 RepID=UPI000ACCEEC9|nr:WXG100 family type VII secretion target [Knoellia sp. Soil729]
MTRMRVDAEVVAALGMSLAETASDLESVRDGSVDRWALGAGQSSEAFDDLLRGWRRSRLQLVEALRDLSEKAARAGTAYVETESDTHRMFGGETR